ncbi:MAG: cbb3-type cytochrome oxidase assembly protein CcoS [Acetobacteraceae bacterium]|nr:cbb3-type cytochrome oxidase assembly protein CcoS [Acetobacteraceae bacterium]
MISLIYLIPISIGLGAIGLGSFIWCINNDQYDDVDGAAQRILFQDDTCPDLNNGPRGHGPVNRSGFGGSSNS